MSQQVDMHFVKSNGLSNTTLVLCSLKVVALKGHASAHHAYDTLEILDFLSRHLGPMNEMRD